MLATGNGTAGQCARNLLSIVRGECPYERCKGLDADLTDAPMTGVFGRVAEDVSWVLKYYEPRVSPEDTSLMIENVLQGKFKIGAAMSIGG